MTDGQRKRNPVADVIGACFRSWREGDERTRRNVRGWLAILGGGGLSVWISVQAWNVAEEGIRRSWQVSDSQQAALVAALKDQTVEISKLVDAIAGDKAQRDRDHAIMLERLSQIRRSHEAAEKPDPKKQRKPIEPPAW